MSITTCSAKTLRKSKLLTVLSVLTLTLFFILFSYQISLGETRVTTIDNLNVREPGGLSGFLIGVQSIGKTGSILSIPSYFKDGYRWVPVDFDEGPDGWVADAFLFKEVNFSAVSEISIPVEELGRNDRIITIENLNVRRSVGISSEKIIVLPSGSKGMVLSVTPVSIDGYDWVQVRFDSGFEGWVVKRYLSKFGYTSSDNSDAELNNSMDTDFESSISSKKIEDTTTSTSSNKGRSGGGGGGGGGNNGNGNGGGGGGSVSAPTITLAADSTQVEYNASTTLTWTVSGSVTSCTATGAWSGSKSTAGSSESTGALTSTSTYSLQCTGEGGSSEIKSVTIGVDPEPVSVSACSDSNVLCVDDTSGSYQEYATIQSAIDAASGSTTILVKAGTYKEEVTIDKDNITLKAYPGDERLAILSGATAISGWSLADSGELDGNPNASNIYSATTVCDVERVFQNNTELKPSRYPNDSETGQSRYVFVTSLGSNSYTTFTGSSLGKSANYFTGSRAHVRQNQYRIAASRVASQTSGGEVTLSSSLRTYPAAVDFGFYFTQVIGEISSNGEWAYEGGKLYLMSSGSPTNIEVACKDDGITLAEGADNVTISGLTIDKYNNNGIYTVQSNDNITISNNKVSSCRNAGIMLYNESVISGQGPITVEDNEIDDCRFMGIQARNLTAASTITGNTITNIGAKAYDDDYLHSGDHGQGSGIYVINSPGISITQNRLDKLAYNGIFFVDFGNLNGGNRTASYNYITDAMLALNDGGALYTDVYEGENQASPDTFSYNIVKDAVGSWLGTSVPSGRFPQGAGVYFDNASQYVTASNNTLIGNGYNIFLNSARNSTSTNNTLYEAAGSRGSLYSAHYLECNSGSNVARDNVLSNNIFFRTQTSRPLIQSIVGYSSCAAISESTNNTFYGGAALNYLNHYISSSDTATTHTLSDWLATFNLEQGSNEVSTCSAPQIVINPTMDSVSCSSLTSCTDLDGANASSLSLGGYESKILCGCSSTPTCE